MKQKRRTKAQIAAEHELEFVAVGLVGYLNRVPRSFNDNYGAWPVRVATTKTPADIHKRTDLESPIHSIVLLHYVWTESDAHARRLKDILDGLLLGRGRLRHGWRDVSDCMDLDGLARAWTELLREAVFDIMLRGEDFEVFDESERQARIRQQMRRT